MNDSLVAFDPLPAVLLVDADVRSPAGSYPNVLVGVAASAPAPDWPVSSPTLLYVLAIVTPPGSVTVTGLPSASYAVVNVEFAAVVYAAVNGSTRDSCSPQLL